MMPTHAQSNLIILSNDNNTPVPPPTYSYFTYTDLAPALAAADVSIFNVTMDSLGKMHDEGLSWYYAKFAFDGPSDIGIDTGIVLSTGFILKTNVQPPGSTIPGPFSGISWPAVYNSGAYNPGGQSIMWPSSSSPRLYQHADLVAMNNGDSIADAVILEFDLVPKGDRLRLQYVFASEEYPNMDSANYPDRVCDMPNDVMAILLSGPGIIGEKNIALVPGTSLPVGVNTITPPGMACNPELDNSQYYVDNTGGQNVIYNGFTSVLNAYSAVTPCDTYHLRIAVADGALHTDDSLSMLYIVENSSDPVQSLYDSGIFLKLGSLTSIDKFSVYAYGGLAADTLSPYAVRGCLNGGFRVYRDWPAPYPQTLSFTLLGNAVPGIDFSPIPNTLTIPAGADHVDIPVQALSTGGPLNGNRYLQLSLNMPTNSACAAPQGNVISNTLAIRDELWADIMTPDTTICSGCSLQIQVDGEDSLLYLWTPSNGLDNPDIKEPVATPATATKYFMTATAAQPVNCPPATDSITISTGSEGIRETETIANIAISPNPFTTTFQLQLNNERNNKPFHLVLTNLSGQTILSLKGTIPELNRALATRKAPEKLPPGIYSLSIRTENEQPYSFKLLKLE